MKPPLLSFVDLNAHVLGIDVESITIDTARVDVGRDVVHPGIVGCRRPEGRSVHTRGITVPRPD